MMPRCLALFTAAVLVCLTIGGALAAPERMAIYMTVAGPLEVVRDGASSSVYLGGRVIHQATGAALTAQSYMSVGEAGDGYDALLIRHGVGNAECPITYDLVAVGADKAYAVVPDINKCSRLVNINVDGDKLMLVTEKQNGRTEVIEYNDKQRRAGGKP
ncbi:MAG: hypothetical protein ACP59X_02990 [Solidesulfovibrio sp. DCME]|uniref:hypothetical protein n=1 Tax=Solidesulfovibrio sp. DCME TaxID=3447380 RepID=UPI003D0CA656